MSRRICLRSVFGLEPGTSYDLRLRLSDPDAPAGSQAVERILTPRTRAVPKPATGGAVYHVYPRDYSGAKLEPNFNSLMAAYNTGRRRRLRQLVSTSSKARRHHSGSRRNLS